MDFCTTFLFYQILEYFLENLTFYRNCRYYCESFCFRKVMAYLEWEFCKKKCNIQNLMSFPTLSSNVSWGKNYKLVEFFVKSAFYKGSNSVVSYSSLTTLSVDLQLYEQKLLDTWHLSQDLNWSSYINYSRWLLLESMYRAWDWIL